MSSPPHFPGAGPLGSDPLDDFQPRPTIASTTPSRANVSDGVGSSSASWSPYREDALFFPPELMPPRQQSQRQQQQPASSQSYPLSGASVYILTDDDDDGGSSAKDDMMAFVAALGGEVVPSPSDATHALYVPSSSSSSSSNRQRQSGMMSPQLESAVVQCQALSVPIVDSTWVERMSGLGMDEHWSEIDVGSHVPPLVAMIGMRADEHGRDDDGDDDEQQRILGAGSPMDVDEDGVVTADDVAVGVPIEMIGEEAGWDGGGTRAAPLPPPTIGDAAGDGGNDSSSGSGGGGTRPQRRSKRDRWHNRSLDGGGIGIGGGISIGDRAGAPGSIGQPPRLLQRGRDAASRLSRSISETFAYLSKEQPDLMEEDAVRRAMELSMLDCALVFRRGGSSEASAVGKKKKKDGDDGKPAGQPHEVLGVDRTATPAQIKAAYRKLALRTHPDKGGDADEFFRIARAYRALLDPSHEDHPSPTVVSNIKSTAHWDSELQDHRRLVEDLFVHHGANLDTNVAKLSAALHKLGLVERDAGATNRNERDELINNSCFYLSLAASYLRGIGALTCVGDDLDDDADDGNDDDNAVVDVDDDDDDDRRALREADEALTGETALQLKRIIEAAVVRAHPEWAARGMVGEEVQAFSDFLVYVLDSPTLLGDWAVAVFDTTSGYVDVYKGRAYGGIASNNADWARSNTLTLRYVPGHYQPLVGVNPDPKVRPTLDEVLACLDEMGVFYVVTDGAA